MVSGKVPKNDCVGLQLRSRTRRGLRVVALGLGSAIVTSYVHRGEREQGKGL